MQRARLQGSYAHLLCGTWKSDAFSPTPMDMMIELELSEASGTTLTVLVAYFVPCAALDGTCGAHVRVLSLAAYGLYPL